MICLSGCGVLGGGGTEIGTTNPGKVRDTTPVVRETTQPGIAVVDTEKALMDYSNASDGYISVLSKLDGIKVKVLVKVDGSQYQYTIENSGYYITVPLSCGSKVYSVGVYENIEAGTDKYASIFAQDLDVAIADEFSPFLYPSQYVNYAKGDASTQLSQQYSTGATSDVEALNSIYKYVVENIVYDYDKAATVQPGYLPNNTDTINTKTGICFDFAVLTVAMLRVQNIPAQLVVGYSDTAYHAWIKVYSSDNGNVIGQYEFKGSEWVRMDPTFDAANKGLQNLSGLIGNGTNYQPMFYY
jgi:transglutaminase-like putative cysteine protease